MYIKKFLFLFFIYSIYLYLFLALLPINCDIQNENSFKRTKTEKLLIYFYHDIGKKSIFGWSNNKFARFTSRKGKRQSSIVLGLFCVLLKD